VRFCHLFLVCHPERGEGPAFHKAETFDNDWEQRLLQAAQQPKQFLAQGVSPGKWHTRMDSPF
jgi:hypothetical protein